jgi:CxxC-x17-CxxC domain-containing protein
MRNFNNDRGFKSFDNRGFGDKKQKKFSRNRGSFGRDRSSQERQMYEAVCDKCGKICQLPFMPTGEKPVYCSNCFEKTGDREGNKRRFDNRLGHDHAQENIRAEIEIINQKLDKILAALGSQVPVKKIKRATTESAGDES